MKTVVFLRIASVLTLIHSVLHTIGGVFGKPVNAAAAAVAANMRTPFPVLGVTRSYSDFYLGMGLAVTIFLTMDAALLWVLSNMARSDGVRLRPLIFLFAFGYLAFAADSYLLFFSLPVITELLIAGFLIAAGLTAGAANPVESNA